MQNSVISAWITSLYGSQPSSVVFASKTATFGAELQVPMCPRHNLSFCACKPPCLATELQVSMGSSSHLWFMDAKQCLLDQIYKSLWVPDLTCRFVHANRVIITRIASVYGFQPSSVVLCIQNSDLKTKLHVSMHGSQTSPVIFCMQTACLASELLVSMGPRPYLCFCARKTAPLGPDIQVRMGPRPHLLFCACKTA